MVVKRKKLVSSALCFVLGAATICGCSNAAGGAFDLYQPLHNSLNQGKYDELIGLCNESLRVSPDDAESLAYRGAAERHLGKYVEAKADLLKAISLNASQGWYHRELGDVYLQSGKNEDALRAFLKAMTLVSDSAGKAQLHSAMALAYERLDEPEKSIQEADEALKMVPTQNYTYQTRAYAYLKLNEIERALSDANKSVELDNGNVNAYTSRAVVYLFAGDFERATADAQKSLSLDRNCLHATEVLSAINLAQGKYVDALKFADQLIEKYPKSVVGYDEKAVCCLAMNDLAQARKLIDKALELNASDQRAIEAELLFEAKSGDETKVAEQLSRLEKILGGSRRIARDRALAMLLLKKYKEAIEYCTEVIGREGKSPSLYRIRSEAYMQLQKNDLADADMKKALAQGYVRACVLERYLTIPERTD